MKLVNLSFLTAIALACQETQTSADNSAKMNGRSSAAVSASTPANESDSSEGVVGPDEAYFAGVFLESVFKASKTNPHPLAADAGISLKNEGLVEAFDFAANLQPRRLEFMAKILLTLGDKDKDGKLNFEEFSAIQLSPELEGTSGALMGHEFDRELFDTVSADHTLLSEQEIQDLLIRIAGISDLSKMSKQDIRNSLVKGWEKIIASYDTDKDGRPGLEEQRRLRKDRALIMGRFVND